MAYFSVFMGLGMFFGSLTGWALQSWLTRNDLPVTLHFGGWSYTPASVFIYVLFISAVVRFAACAFFLLVFVRYAPQHLFQEEWVGNAAGIDGSRVVWPRGAFVRTGFPGPCV